MAEAKKKTTKKDKPVGEAQPAVEAVTIPETTEEVAEVKDEKPVVTAKAGRHSAKALKEAEEKQAKEERKASKTEAKTAESKKTAKKPARSRVERAGKKYRDAAKLIDGSKTYGLQEALEVITKTSPTKFDATLEMHANLNVDPTQADQNVRGTVVLPAGSGKTLRIAVLADVDDAAAAKSAGASLAGEAEILSALDKEKIDFDILITTGAMMPKLGKYARLLGPRGLMPNPKSGTVTTDITKAVAEAKAGRVEYRVDQAGIVHAAIGKVSFGTEKLLENTEVMLASLRAAKPASLKGAYIKSVYLATTMGPSVKINSDNS